ncbi:MAG: hypothetical protein H7Y30_12840 [Pyrinomonadaceae bacterium]|nr:hypothetical protein [Pyrinomonadaceae bacterium]
MKILENAREVSKAVIDSADVGEALKNAAIKATIGGIESPEWENYMKIFADNDKQLARLTTVDTQNAWVNESIAYLVSNAICGAATTGSLTQRIDPNLDENVDSSVTPEFRNKDILNL